MRLLSDGVFQFLIGRLETTEYNPHLPAGTGFNSS